MSRLPGKIGALRSNVVTLESAAESPGPAELPTDMDAMVVFQRERTVAEVVNLLTDQMALAGIDNPTMASRIGKTPDEFTAILEGAATIQDVSDIALVLGYCVRFSFGAITNSAEPLG